MSRMMLGKELSKDGQKATERYGPGKEQRYDPVLVDMLTDAFLDLDFTLVRNPSRKLFALNSPSIWSESREVRYSVQKRNPISFSLPSSLQDRSSRTPLW